MSLKIDFAKLRRQVDAHPYPLVFATISGAHLYRFYLVAKRFEDSLEERLAPSHRQHVDSGGQRHQRIEYGSQATGVKHGWRSIPSGT